MEVRAAIGWQALVLIGLLRPGIFKMKKTLSLRSLCSPWLAYIFPILNLGTIVKNGQFNKTARKLSQKDATRKTNRLLYLFSSWKETSTERFEEVLEQIVNQ